MSGPHGPDFVDWDVVQVSTAVRAIEAFGGHLDRQGAEVILPFYIGYDQLTEAQREDVLARFGDHVVAKRDVS